MNWINTYVDDYYSWLRNKTIVQQGTTTDWFLIDTPFLGAFNDTIEIYAQRNDNHIKLSDNGETLNNLEIQGVQIQGSKIRKNLLDSILLNNGVKNINGELIIETTSENFSQSKHNLLSTILEITDLYVLSKNSVSSIFKEDVRSFLDEQNIIYTPDFISKGITGLEFNFDFQIAQKSKEIVIKSFNTINKTTLSTFLFSWGDIKPLREKTTKKEVKAIAIINDIEREIKEEYLNALRSQHAEFILWSEKDSDKCLELLVA